MYVEKMSLMMQIWENSELDKCKRNNKNQGIWYL